MILPKRRLPPGRVVNPPERRPPRRGALARLQADEQGHAVERRLLRRARHRLTVQVAGAISVLLLLVGVLVFCFMTHQQSDAARRDLAAAVSGGSLAHPPPCVWLYEVRDGAVRSSPGAPRELPVSLAATSSALVEEVQVAGRAYLIRTQRRGDTTVQAAMDLRYQAAERGRLLRTLGAAEIAGLVAALLVGQVISRRAIAPLGEALARQRRFAADLSHELRTPLTRLHTRAQLLSRRMRGGTDPILLIDEVDHLVTGSGQLGEVVADLLQSAQFQQLRRPFGPVDLALLASELAVAENARAQARGVTIEVRSEGPGDHVVLGVESALRRVVSALLDNALGHTRSGGHIWLTLSRDHPGDHPARSSSSDHARNHPKEGCDTVVLTVRDDGTGLDPAHAERLFARFVGGGFGLGLALVREVVAGHHGTITADGRPGAGATFTVRLPAAPAGAAAPVAATRPRAGLGGLLRP
ncbi:sensor histidine kinase [Nonomuraea phyllanthi]|uniref:sensor histidine kinase n=1 Tax=Nonomuraea phyllanthi TaxID=2219224 RepID=UPI001D14611A|nr:HAMP domain-containing sensor histidine kinase [Nonomuraea phyllanthi]